MADSFDAFEYLDFLRKRWVFAAAAVGLAALIAVAACLLLTRQYTATATLLIEPPGADPRTSVAVSSVYLESLKSYESFASSDSLFAKACAKFHLLDGKTSLEAFKRRVLRVEKLKDTKVLEIAVTLPDPRQAQALVQYLAESTVDLALTLSNNEERDLTDGAHRQLDAAQQEVARARAETGAVEAPQAVLQQQVQSIQDRLTRAEADRAEQNLVVAESVARGEPNSAAAARAGLAALATVIDGLQKDLDAKSSQLSALNVRKQSADDRRLAAEDALDRAQKDWDALSATTAYRSERIRVVDPGVIPQTPSFPNLPVALLSAVLMAAALSLVWLTIQFGFASRRAQTARAGLRVAGGGLR